MHILTQNLFTKRLEPGLSHLRRKQDTRSVTKIWGCIFVENGFAISWVTTEKINLKNMYNVIKKSIMLILVPQLTNWQTDKIIHTVVFILNDYINACLPGWH